MRANLSTLVLAAALLPLSASANTLAVRAKSQTVAVPTVGRTLHLVDFRPEGVDYYVSARIVTQARSSSDTGSMSLGVVVALPSAPTQVEPVPSGLFTGFDTATSGQVLACDSASGGGCTDTDQFTTGAAPDIARMEGGNVPLRSALVAATAADAIAFLKGQALEVEPAMQDSIEAIYEKGLVAWVGYLSDQDQLLFGLGGFSRAVSLRFTFEGAQGPFKIPLDVQPTAASQTQGEVATNVIVLGRGLGALDGVELVPVDVTAIHSPNSDPDRTSLAEPMSGDPAFTPRSFDQVIRDTLGGRGGSTFVRETAQFLHLGSVSSAMPACVFGEDSPDCFDKGQCFDDDCVGPVPPEPPFDAGVRSDGGTRTDGGPGDAGDGGLAADAGSSDAGVVKPTTAHAALSRIFFEDRFATRLTTLSRAAALKPISVRTDGATEGVGPGYRNCPEGEEEGGCSSAPGPARFTLIFLALALLLRKRFARV